MSTISYAGVLFALLLIGLRRLLKIKNKELRHMRALAENILAQRGEVEQFFLESLHEVKEMISREKQRSNVDALKTLNHMRARAQNTSVKQTGSTFPSIKVTGVKHLEPKHTSALHAQETSKVRDS